MTSPRPLARLSFVSLLCSMGLLACAKPPAAADNPPTATQPNTSGASVEEPPRADPGAGLPCSSDADCVPAECCHPSACVLAQKAPECSDVACTEECRGGTMDCGQGHCACQDGTCVAVIDNPLE